MDIPAVYEKYNKGQNVDLDTRLQLYYKQFEGGQHKPIVFVDSNDVRKTIILFPWDKHINLTNKLAGFYLGLLNRQLKKSIVGLATNSKLLEKKNYDGQAQLIKVKYELEFENQVQYSTNYLISVGNKTFAIYHNTYNLEEDFESNLLKLKRY